MLPRVHKELFHFLEGLLINHPEQAHATQHGKMIVSDENEDIEERELKQKRRDSVKACLIQTHDHCIEYFEKSMDRSKHYEEWISLLHPDNVKDVSPRNQDGKHRCIIDHRFYVRDSDHRIIWNGYCDMYGRSERKIYHHELEEKYQRRNSV